MFLAIENIGFARSGMECRYNIGIMEERQSVIGIEQELQVKS
jgi:oxygen-independent coproporphyrinogen-3 oxidase